MKLLKTFRNRWEYLAYLDWLGDRWAGNSTEGSDDGQRYMTFVERLRNKQQIFWTLLALGDKVRLFKWRVNYQYGTYEGYRIVWAEEKESAIAHTKMLLRPFMTLPMAHESYRAECVGEL